MKPFVRARTHEPPCSKKSSWVGVKAVKRRRSDAPGHACHEYGQGLRHASHANLRKKLHAYTLGVLALSRLERKEKKTTRDTTTTTRVLLAAAHPPCRWPPREASREASGLCYHETADEVARAGPNKGDWVMDGADRSSCELHEPLNDSIEIRLFLGTDSITGHLPVSYVLQRHGVDQLVYAELIWQVRLVAQYE